MHEAKEDGKENLYDSRISQHQVYEFSGQNPSDNNEITKKE